MLSPWRVRRPSVAAAHLDHSTRGHPWLLRTPRSRLLSSSVVLACRLGRVGGAVGATPSIRHLAPRSPKRVHGPPSVRACQGWGLGRCRVL